MLRLMTQSNISFGRERRECVSQLDSSGLRLLVTAEYAIKLLRPTPTDRPVRLVARVVEATGDRATVMGELIAGDKVTATSRGVFVAVQPGHPAYHRW
jgi:acyl-coenzyme A thioesterase PaaI-like protein